MSAGRERPGACEECGSHLQRGQGYCLGCGRRAGPRSPQLSELLRRVGAPVSRAAGAREDPSPPAAAPPTSAAPADRRSRPGTVFARMAALSLPSARVSALLVLAFLGFGILLGNVASTRVDYTLAASERPRLKLVLPPAATPGTGSSSEAGESAAEPPQSSPEATPEAAATATVPAAASPGPASSAPAPSRTPQQVKKSSPAPAPAGEPASKLPAIKHVFVIMLSDQPYAAVFGPASQAPYLSHTLESRGELLARYYAVAHEQLANGIALLSGQGPTPATAANCPLYSDIAPATAGAEEEVAGEGCVYPAATGTLAGQLSAKHLTWRAYVQGIDEAAGTPAACAHPVVGQSDPTSAATPSQPYATFRNPLMYFHSVIDSPSCASDDVGLSRLSADLGGSKRTPSLSYIVPDRCDDGSSEACASGASAGLPAADSFLKQVVPEILASKAYKDGGLLAITVDEAPSSGEFADSSSCCGQPQYPNLPAAAGAVGDGEANGGGQVGALLLSPFVKPHTISQESYNHYSLLRTIEDVFALKHLGYAGLAKVKALEPSLFAAKR